MQVSALTVKNKNLNLPVFMIVQSIMCVVRNKADCLILGGTQFPERNIACGTGIGCDRNLYCSFRPDDCTYFLSELAFPLIDLCCQFSAPFASHFSRYISMLQTINIKFYCIKFCIQSITSIKHRL